MKYSLIGVDGNAYAIMGYTARALKNENLRDLVDKMYEKATSADYSNLIAVCDGYIDMANEVAENNSRIERGVRKKMDYTIECENSQDFMHLLEKYGLTLVEWGDLLYEWEFLSSEAQMEIDDIWHKYTKKI